MKKQPDKLLDITLVTKMLGININLRPHPAVGTIVNWPRGSQKLDLYKNEEGMHGL